MIFRVFVDPETPWLVVPRMSTMSWPDLTHPFALATMIASSIIFSSDWRFTRNGHTAREICNADCELKKKKEPGELTEKRKEDERLLVLQLPRRS